MNSNFKFLDRYWYDLYELGSDAENQLYYDNNACALKAGTLAEKIVNEIFISERLEDYINESQFKNIEFLSDRNLIPKIVADQLHHIRMMRNNAGHHGEYASDEEAEKIIHGAYIVAKWFAEMYGGGQIRIPPYRKPFPKTSNPSASKPVIIVKEKEPAENKGRAGVTILKIALAASVLLNIYFLIKYII